MKIPDIVLLLSILFILPVRGQETDQQEPEDLEVTFSVFPLEPSDWSGIYYAPNGDPADEPQEIIFNQLERSISYEYKGPPPLRFFRIETNEEGLETYKIVGQITPGTGRIEDDLILFFDLGKDVVEPFVITKMPDNEDTFPDESLVFFNTMPVTFQGVLGSQKLTIPPGASDPIPVSDYFTQQVPIAMAINRDNERHLVLRNKVQFSPERRTLIILRRPDRPNSLRIRTQRLTEYTGERASDPPEETGDS